MFYAQTTDPLLIEAAKDWKNEEGWVSFYERYAPCIRRHAMASGLAESDAEDVVQETMVKVSRYLPGFEYDRTVCKFRTWLNQVVNQRIFEVLHSQRKRRFSESSLDEVRGIVQVRDAPVENPVAQAEAERRLLEACLARVRADAKPWHWQLFESHALRGVSARETARLFQTTAANVWIVRHRLVNALRVEWQALLEKPFPKERQP